MRSILLQMRYLQAILFAGILLCNTNTLSAQELPFHNLRVHDGLPSNFITAFAQDQKGYLWIGTGDGLRMFDGIDCIQPAWTVGLPDWYVFDLHRDPMDGMWITSGDSLLLVRNSVATGVRFRNRDEKFRLTAIEYIPGKGIWAGGSQGLARVVGDTLVPVPVPPKLRGVVRMQCDRKGMLWILNELGVHVFDPATGIGTTIDSSIGCYTSANGLRCAGNNDIFVCSRDSSILQIRDRRVIARHRLPEAQPMDILQDDNGSWWITSNNGLFFCEGDSLDISKAAHYSMENGLPSNRLNYALMDAERVLWFGTQGNGIVSLEDRALQVFEAPDMSGKGAADRHGRLWMTSHLGIWEYWREGSQWKRMLHRREQHWPEGYSYHVQATEDDRLWVSFHSNAISIFDIRRPSTESAALRLIRTVMPAPGLPEADSFCFLIDRGGRLWTKTRISDLAVLDVRGRTALLRRFLDFHPDIRTLYEDPSGTIWIGGYNGGVYMCDDAGLAAGRLHRSEYPSAANIRAFLRGRDGKMWLGTLNGILVETAAGWQQINAGDGLPGNRVTALAESPDGRIWVGTQSGVASISPDLTSVFQHPGLTDSPVGACGVQNNGLVWIATASSLTLYDRSRSFLDTVPPRIELRGIAVNGSPRMYTAGMRLSNIENNIRIDVASIRMRKADALRYQYRFVGIDSAWSAASASRNLSFPALQPGSYALEIRALSAELIPSIAPLFLRFSVSPPFWQRWWFYPAIVVTIGLVLMAFYRIRMQRLLATERIRTRIAADLHDDIGSGLTRIAMMSDVMMQQTRQVTEGLQADATFSLDGLRSTISRSGTIARELVESMSDVVWSLDPRNDSVGQIADRLRVFAFDLADGAEITLDFTVTDVARQLRTSSEISRSLLLVMKEALSNTVRHANANHLRVQISSADSSVSFLVEDDGRGFDPDRLARRSGLVHMEQRVASCGGSFEVRTSLDSGTHISGTIPLS